MNSSAFPNTLKKIWRIKAQLQSLWVPCSQPPHTAIILKVDGLKSKKDSFQDTALFKASEDLKTTPTDFPGPYGCPYSTLILTSGQTDRAPFRSPCECGFCQLQNDPQEILQSYKI